MREDMTERKNKEDHLDLDPAKLTGYFYDGQEIVATKRRGKPPRYNKNPVFFSQERKEQAATLYCVYGDMDEVSRLTDVPISFIRLWKQEPWWIEIQKQVYVEQNENLAARISTTLDKTLAQLTDRLEMGDVYYDKAGIEKRKPVNTKVLAEVFTTLSHQRQVTRGEPTSIVARIGMEDRLKVLQDAFLRFAEAKTIEGEVVA
jgi:hypothetical protein